MASPPLLVVALGKSNGLLTTYDMLRLRLLSGGALRALGHVRVHRYTLQEPLVFSAETYAEANGVHRGDVPSRRAPEGAEETRAQDDTSEDEGEDVESMGHKSGPLLSAAMRNCQSLCWRTQSGLLEDLEQVGLAEAVSVRGASCAHRILAALRRLAREVKSGRVTGTRSFAERARAAVTDVLVSEGLMRQVFMQTCMRCYQDFEAELLLVEVPEVECAYLPVGAAGHGNGHAVLWINMRLSLDWRSTSTPEVPTSTSLPQRWLWAEIRCYDGDGVELDGAPRVRIDVGPPFPGVGVENRVNFQRRITCTFASGPEARLLCTLRGRKPRELRFFLRADWLVLQHFQFYNSVCHVDVAELQLPE
eukprot:CAMPEP_0117534080 /NCGR_PEP_ID=MMETSP0784-20121206/40225_1 /TAXON_ID=39447 /ORGANISM="" /LENGTH=362 /DNA_ID=CAMNT_0005330545 /DNA_START=64 /DNA_END=1152 /DNA_ORIENTATION=-